MPDARGLPTMSGRGPKRGGFRGRGSKFGRGRGGPGGSSNDGGEGDVAIDASLMPVSHFLPWRFCSPPSMQCARIC